MVEAVNTYCRGCDGQPGSTKVVDRCGVCGGFNECDCSGHMYAKQKTQLQIVWGLRPQNKEEHRDTSWMSDQEEYRNKVGELFDPHAASRMYPIDETFVFQGVETQRHLYWVCEQLEGRDDLINPLQSDCFMTQFKDFLYRHMLVVENKKLKDVYECSTFRCPEPPEYNHLEQLFPLRFPLLPPNGIESTGVDVSNLVDWVVYKFAEKHQKFDQIGFNSADPQAGHMRVRWVRMKFTIRMDADANTDDAMKNFTYWQTIVKNINEPSWQEAGQLDMAGSCFQWSQQWIDMFHKLQVEKGVSYAIGLSGTGFIVIVFVYTCSPLLTITSGYVVTTSAVFVLSAIKLAGWTLGPAEQAGLAVMMGIATEYSVHIVEGYIEYLHATQSTMLARQTTRAQAIAGTLQRTGVPITVSAISMTFASCVLLNCQILVYVRVAEIVIMSLLFAAFHGIVILPALLSGLGPTAVTRTTYMRCIIIALCAGSGAFVIIIIYLSGNATGPTGEPLFD